jgi:hypothetical protein
LLRADCWFIRHETLKHLTIYIIIEYIIGSPWKPLSDDNIGQIMLSHKNKEVIPSNIAEHLDSLKEYVENKEREREQCLDP